MSPDGRTFLVTGAASGLGAATARLLAASGARVVAADLSISSVEQAAQTGDVRMHPHVCDVTDAASTEGAVAAAVALGAFSGVVHCAGIVSARRLAGRAGPHPLEEFERVVRVNLVGSFNVARLVAAALQRESSPAGGERGVILLTASVAAWEGQIGQAAYAASKGGVASLVLPLARELGPLGVRVLAIAPGVFDTPMVSGMPESVRASLAAQIPFPRRPGAPEEFASLAIECIRNPYLNGTTLRLDGAVRMGQT